MRKRIYAFLLSVCFIFGMVRAGWAEADDDLKEQPAMGEIWRQGFPLGSI